MPERRPTWGQARRYCERQGFRPSTTDHEFYDKVLPDGSTAGTKISFGATETAPLRSSLWPRVWKRQLRLRAEDEFWRGIDGAPINYDVPPAPEPPRPLPGFLARHLRYDRHMPVDVIAATPREKAQQLFDAWHSRESDEG